MFVYFFSGLLEYPTNPEKTGSRKRERRTREEREREGGGGEESEREGRGRETEASRRRGRTEKEGERRTREQAVVASIRRQVSFYIVLKRLLHTPTQL